MSLKDIQIQQQDSSSRPTDQGDLKAKEKHLVSPKLIAYLKCLIIVGRLV